MIPKPPPREGSLGFLFTPPYRVQGTSVAGEQTCVMVPELDLCFDIGVCPRAALASKFLAISHGHMDHIGGLAYWCSQRNFQGMGPGTIVCSTQIERAIRKMLGGYAELEGQRMPFEIIALDPEGEIEIKNTMFLRAFDLEHTSPTSGYVVVEKRSKLRDEYAGLPQEKLKEIKDSGQEITRILEVPLVAYLSDTAPGPALLRPDVLNAKVVIAECTFVEPDHRDRAQIGKHLHLDNVAEWLPLLQCETLVLIHLSRRSNIGVARKRLRELTSKEHARRVEFLMDFKSNKIRYERQEDDARRTEAQRRRAR
jgi:ribonuclease Z